MLADLWGTPVCSLCAHADDAVEPLPLVSEILLAVAPPDPVSRAAALAGQSVPRQVARLSQRRAANAAAAMRYRERKKHR